MLAQQPLEQTDFYYCITDLVAKQSDSTPSQQIPWPKQNPKGADTMRERPSKHEITDLSGPGGKANRFA